MYKSRVRCGWAVPVLVCSAALVGCKSSTDKFAVEKDPAPSASVESAITFSAKHAAVGNKQRVFEKSSISVQMTARGINVSLTDETATEKTAEAVAVNGELYTRVLLVYSKYEHKTADNGNARPSEVDLTGKSYLLERRGTELLVTDPNGAPVSAAEAKAVTSDSASFGKADKVDVVLASKARKIGAPMDDVAEALRQRLADDFNNGSGNVDVRDLRVDFHAVEPEADHRVATFGCSFVAEMNGGPVVMTMTVAGPVRLRVDDTTEGGVSFAGPIVISGAASGNGAVVAESKTIRLR
jgi:hypothetical protein